MLNKIFISLSYLVAALAFTTFGAHNANAQRVLPGHVPQAVNSLSPIGTLPQDTQLQLAIGLPVRDAAGLAASVKDVSDPKSPNFRHYLTPDQFTETFGPTEQDYQAVINFAQSHGLTVTATHPNRLIVDVTGAVRDIEKAFHISLRIYQHPTENRTFYAPDTNPSIDEAVPILHIGGLDNYSIPKPRLKVRPQIGGPSVFPKGGSGPSGTYMGSDFRAAYVPGISLTGTGQAVGLLEFDGYRSSDIAAYEQEAGIASVPLQNILIDGYSGGAGSGNDEVCLDIEMAVSMAPGLSKVIVYEAPNSSSWEDILNPMANDNAAKQLSCSWGGGPPDATAEEIFEQMAMQGQTFFNATGDTDAYTGEIPFPSDSPNVVEVGGTTLYTVSPLGAWSSETTWNWGYYEGGYVGSSGGISTYYSIPSWQQGLSMSTNQGSTSFRNFPDVALTADNVFVISSGGQSGDFGGTSCATPLWAAFTALVNQQAANNGDQPVGFINPAIYAIGQSGGYASDFHDITTGNNITNRSNGRFSAVTGYDLCTGWGTPNSPLIAALVSPGSVSTNYTVTTSVNPANAGTVSGAGSYSSGQEATVIATANSGYVFTNWTEGGNIVSTSASYSFPVNSNVSLVANFASSTTYYIITVSTSSSKEGSVSGGGRFPSGSLRTVYASPKSGYVFSSWTESGRVVSTSADYSFTLTANQNLVAQFAKQQRGRGGPGNRDGHGSVESEDSSHPDSISF